MGDILPPLPPDSADGAPDGASAPGAGGDAVVSSVRAPSGPAFGEAEALLPVFKDARKELLELKGQVGGGAGLLSVSLALTTAQDSLSPSIPLIQRYLRFNLRLKNVIASFLVFSVGEYMRSNYP